MLRVARSITWTSDTVEEILTLGNRIYDNNQKHGVGQEVMPTDIVEKIILGRNGYRIEAEQAVFGVLSSTSPTVVDLHTGLTNFFASFDAGILQGPQTVAVWHDLRHFYMFDAKERDRYGRKWVASLVLAEFCGGDMELMGRACVTRYRNLEDLVQVYTETVQLKRRHDAFRITRIEVNDYKEHSDNWNEWKGIAINHWILRGRFSQGNQRFAEDNRNCQATCIAAVALVFSGLVEMNEWNADVVDEILTIGDVYYRQCVESLMKEEKLVQKELCVGELVKYFTCREQNIELIVDECLVNGSLLAGKSNEFIDLKTAFDMFFTNNNCGILTACGQSLAFWRVAGAFYVFDSHARNSEGRNPMTCRQNLQTGILGTSCVLRFLCLSALTKAVTDNFQLKDAPEFNLSRIDYVVVEADGAPPLRRYATFGERSAILRSMTAVHEGQRQLYDLRSDRQTLCNCLVALSMVQLNHSVNWTRSDLFDILRMGDQMFIRISQAVSQPIDDDFAVDWEHLLSLDGITIGINRFTVSVENVDGQFELSPVEASEDIVKTISITDSKRSKFDSQDSVKTRTGGSMAHRTGSMLERLSVNVSVHAGTIGSTQSVTSSQRSVKSVVPLPPVLMDLLKKWDEGDSSKAIVQSILFKIAIWKQNKLYFVFDPKACDENGKLTPKRIKRTEKAIRKRRLAEADRKFGSRTSAKTRSSDIIEDIEEKDTSTEKMVPVEQVMPDVEPAFIEEPSEDESQDTSCYSAWFMTLEDLHRHIISLIPEQELRFEAVTLVNVNLSPISAKLPARMISNSNYQLVSENPTKTFILRASMSQSDQIFPKTPNRNRQDITNCVTAIALATFCNAEDWTATILDVVLKYGDRLYTKSLHARAFINSLEKLSIQQVVSPFILANVRIDLHVDRFGTGDMTAEPGSLRIRCVHDVLAEFFKIEGNEFGILVARQYSVAVWRKNEAYYMFDAHEIGPDARKCVNGVACLCHFESLEPMSQVFLANLDGPSGSNAFELYSIKITKTKLPNEVGICTDPIDSSKKYRIPDSEESSAYRGCKEMKILHGNIEETSESLKWNSNPPTACHVVAALAMSRDVKTNFWTPRTIDQILILGSEVYAKTLQHMKVEFDPANDRLPVRRVRKNFPMSGHLVHLELELPKKGIIKSRSGSEISLKIGIFRLFESFDCGTIETPTLIVAVWQECGYFYIFYPNATGSDGLIGGNGTACVIRFTNKAHLYSSFMHNIPKDREGDTFEIRSCDFTLSPLKGRPLRVDDESMGDIVKKSNDSSEASLKPRKKKVKRRTTCYKMMPGNREVLFGTSLARKNEEALMQKQSGAKTIVAIAMSFIEDINRWSSRTVDLIVTSGVRLYNESVVLHKSAEITLCQLPRKLYIGDISLDLQILSPTLCESEICYESLKSFFEEHTMAYMVRNRNVCIAVIRVLNQFFFFDSTPFFKITAVSEAPAVDSTAARVIRFKNFQQLLEHLRGCKLLPTDSEIAGQILMGPIKCWRNN